MSTPIVPRCEAFMIRLRPGALTEWIDLHANVWPELVEEQGRVGISTMSVYALDDERLVVHSVVTRPDAWERLIDLPVHRRWVAESRHLNASAQADDTVQRELLPEVLHLDFPNPDDPVRRAVPVNQDGETDDHGR